jgi:hypothetical protein
VEKGDVRGKEVEEEGEGKGGRVLIYIRLFVQIQKIFTLAIETRL